MNTVKDLICLKKQKLNQNSMSERKPTKEWMLAPNTEHNKPPDRLSEITIMTKDDFVTLDEEVGEDFGVEFTKQPFGEHFNPVLRRIVIRNLDDILTLFHEIGHGVSDHTDPVVKEIAKKVAGKIRSRSISDNTLEEITELLKIRAERMASAYAIKKIRQIRDKYGVDLLKDWDTDAVLSRVHTGIESVYEHVMDTAEYKKKLKQIQEELEITDGKKRREETKTRVQGSGFLNLYAEQKTRSNDRVFCW